MLGSEADYVIIGAGTAGCVVAARLSEDPQTRVVLVEAGGSARHYAIAIPGASALNHRSARDWGFSTTTQRELAGRQVYYPRGKVVGGSGSTNTLLYLRGDARDFDDWAAAGATGWGWSAVKSAYERVEQKLVVAQPAWEHPLWRVFVDAAESVGVPRIEDFNAGSMIGAGLYRMNVVKGLRQSTAAAYLKPAMKRANLRVVTSAQAELALDGKRCVGVTLARDDGSRETIRARGEVILSAGAIASPQLLMHAGIGPAEHLRAVGRPVVLDAPMVGAQLHDHPLVPLSNLGGRGTVNTTLKSMRAMLTYLVRRTGPLSVVMPGAGGFTKTDGGDDARPDIQFHFAAGWAKDLYDLARVPRADGYTVCATVCRPTSRGTLRLGGPTLHDAPLIDPQFFANPEDLATMLRGVKVAHRILAAQAFAPHRLGPALPPTQLTSDEDFVAYIRSACETNYHPVGSCRLGRDGESVVDPALRVRGIERLRVIDASVMPSITTGNTNAPTAMIGERGAALIRET